MQHDMDQEQSAKSVSTENQELQSALTKCQIELAQYVRELEIESALERVRVKAMAMQSSKELSDLVDTVFKELTKLDFAISMCIINIIDESSLSNMVWGANPDTGKPPDSYYMKFEDYPFHHAMMKGYKERNTKFIYVIEGEEKTIYDEYLFTETEFRKMPMEAQAASKALKRYVASFTFSNFGGIQTVGEEPLSDSNLDILARFGKVFDLTYTRFNDLKQAEAQAREAQIQLALERVRARTMAMQQSEELTEVAGLLFKQVTDLGINSWTAGFNVWSDDNNSYVDYITSPNGGFIEPYTVLTERAEALQDISNARKSGVEFDVQYVEGEKIKQLYIALTGLGEEQFDKMRQDGNQFPSHQYEHFVFGSRVSLMFITYEPVPEAHDIFKRFGKVFEQTYTRFLDLQNAEAQARESQIQLAMERVRARTMAMQRSDELPATSYLLFQQVKELGETTVQNSIGIVNEQAGVIELSTTVQGHHLPHTLNVPIDDPYVMAKAVAAWKAQQKSLKLEFEGKELKNYNEHRNSFFETKVNFPEDQWIVNIIFFSKGWLSFSGNKNISDQTFDLLKRFAAVFEQTYTRFNDLKQAEAQAREAQIEAALERVRSRTMAMQHSDELPDTSLVLFQQLKELGEPAEQCTIGIIKELEGVVEISATLHGNKMHQTFRHSIDEPFVMSKMFRSWKDQQKTLVLEIKEEELQKYNQYRNELVGKETFPVKLLAGDRWIVHIAYFSRGILALSTNEPRPAESLQLLERFAKVFEQTYTRFLDLQKAEAQAREAQIEASLERVRSRTMGMQKSEELREVIQLIYEQFLQLNIPLDGAGFAMDYLESDDFNFWLADVTSAFPYKVHIPYFDHPQFNRYKEAKEKGLDFYTSSLTREERNRFFDHLSKYIPIPQEMKEAVYGAPGYETSHVVLKNVILYILNFSGLSFSDAHNATLIRFGKVFEQTYTRFNDLKQAEAQAREAKIEAALEKIRSRSLAMHKSDELADLAAVVFEKLEELQFSLETGPAAGAAFILTPNEDPKIFNLWIGGNGLYPSYFRTPCYEAPSQITDIWKARESGIDFISKIYSFKEKTPWFEYAFKQTDYKILPEELKNWILEQPFLTQAFAFAKNSGIGIHRHYEKELTENEIDILKRFSTVFEQGYIRFLDLQKAEAQTRESQTEAALEKVRSRSMAMQNSNELGEVIQVVFSQFVHLNIAVEHAGFIIDYKKHDDMHIWLADKHVFPSQAVIPYFDSPHWNSFVEAKKTGINLFTNHHGFEEKNSFYQKLLSLFPDVPQETKDHYLNCPGLAISTVLLDTVGLYIENFDGIPFTAEENATLMRFGKVFQQTYTRFQDLQKAEARAKEAKIEAALERTRTQSMLMQHSEQLDETLRVFHEQVLLMGIDSAFSFLWLPDDKNDRHIFWAAWAEEQTSDQNGRPEFKSKAINYPLDRQEPATAQCLVDWKSDQRVHTYHVPPANVVGYFLAWKELLEGVEKLKAEYFREGLYYVEAFMKYGCFGVMVAEDLPEDDKKLLGRFAVEFERTYTRFLDLQKAEAQAREAAKQSALDRIRADIASMRTISDLDRITPLIWNELTILGIPFIRCGVFIMDDTKQLIHSFLSTPEGKAIAAFHLPYNNPGNLAPVLEQWRHKKIYTDYWDKKAFTSFADSLVEQGVLASSKQYLSTIPGDGFHLHFLPFLQGMFYVGNTDPLPEGELTMIKSVADAFSTAYARYEDFNRLEVAKQKVDLTLTELKQAQLQLIQAEKMASLGELTAGIAHEIQNPLNFVNNFSDVNKELIAEMKEEINKGNIEEAKEIANDIEENENKINHHGKRADSIVKGMLQHSRQSTGQKELTDLNALIDEYLKLSYQALRSKDKSFNSAIETNLDKTIGKMDVVPQDLGRVLLNLYNNAFYAVNERRKRSDDTYHPRVDVTTKKLDNRIEIAVIDNGTGIPQDIVDRIYNPFFTTKPTGEGTGLGLSLSYDIIKAHGGEIKVETKDGEGTTFKILLPLSL